MMKHTLVCILTALGALAQLPAQAQSSVTVSGMVDAYAGSMRNAGDAVRIKAANSGGMSTSYFGFSGVEDLGGGLKAVVTLNAFFRTDAGSSGRFDGDPFFARDANVGLTGGFGSILLGRGKAPNFLPTVIVNPFGDSFTFSPLILHANVNTGKWPYRTTPSDTGWGNQIVYTTPGFSGLRANLQYQFGEQSALSSARNLGGNIFYTGGPVTLVAYYERDQVTNPNPALITTTIGGVVMPITRRVWMVGGAYDAGLVKGFASYGISRTEVTNYEGKTAQLGASVPIGTGFILADVARTEVTGPFNGRRTTASVGYDHFVSKRTDLYAIAMRDTVTAQVAGNSFAAGIRHRF